MNDASYEITADIVVTMQPNAVEITTHVDGWSWRCGECGWLDLNCATTEGHAYELGRKHFQTAHGRRADLVATVTPEQSA